MAKKTIVTGGSLMDLIQSVDGSAEILAESSAAVIKDYISTGSYILNAAMTGSIFKGAPTGRVVTLAGDPGTGKSFLAVSMCREAQKKGYLPIYMDSEGAIDIDFIKRLGCDPSKFVLKQVTTISEVSTFVANILKGINQKPQEERDKVVFVLDSLGNLTSDKELTDTIEANQKRDMTKQQEIKALFRTNATALSKAGALMIVNSHVYQTQDFLARKIVSGGGGINYNASVTLMLTTARLDDGESNKISEEKPGKFTKTGVLVTARTEKSRFTIPQSVSMAIPFFKKPNPYFGLLPYMTWESCGVMEGVLLTEKEYAKLSDTEKAKCVMFDHGETKCIAYPKVSDRAKKYVVRHLGECVPIKEFYNERVFTEELLRELDDNAIKAAFELPSSESLENFEEI